MEKKIILRFETFLFRTLFVCKHDINGVPGFESRALHKCNSVYERPVRPIERSIVTSLPCEKAPVFLNTLKCIFSETLKYLFLIILS